MGLLGSLKTFHRNLFVIMSCFTFIEAVKAINRAIFRRTERNFRLFTAFRTNRFKHFPRLGPFHTGLTGSTAGRAAFRFIGKTFLRIKFLF